MELYTSPSSKQPSSSATSCSLLHSFGSCYPYSIFTALTNPEVKSGDSVLGVGIDRILSISMPWSISTPSLCFRKRRLLLLTDVFTSLSAYQRYCVLEWGTSKPEEIPNLRWAIEHHTQSYLSSEFLIRMKSYQLYILINFFMLSISRVVYNIIMWPHDGNKGREWYSALWKCESFFFSLCTWHSSFHKYVIIYNCAY